MAPKAAALRSKSEQLVPRSCTSCRSQLRGTPKRRNNSSGEAYVSRLVLCLSVMPYQDERLLPPGLPVLDRYRKRSPSLTKAAVSAAVPWRQCKPASSLVQFARIKLIQLSLVRSRRRREPPSVCPHAEAKIPRSYARGSRGYDGSD